MHWLLSIAAAATWHPTLDGRFAVANEVLLPRAVWFDDLAGSFGFQTRSWQLRAVFDCGTEPQKRGRLEVRCEVEEAAIQASAFQRTDGDDPAHTVAVLREFVDHIQGVVLITTVSERGHRRTWRVEGAPEGSGRHTRIGRLVGRMVERAAVVLFLERPREPLAVGGQWVESGAALLTYPMEAGAKAVGTSQLLHQVQSVGDPMTIDSVAEGAMLDPDTSEQLRASGRLRSQWSATGAMRSTTWSVDAALQDVVRYHHAGWARRLRPDQQVELGPTQQVRAPGAAAEDDLPGLPAWPEL